MQPKDIAFLAALLALIAVLFSPLLEAGFSGDDWAILARTTHDSGPLGFILHDHSYTYLYRPLCMSFWWLTAQLFGSSAAYHYATNIALHALNVVLVYSLMRRAGVGFAGCAISTLIFSVHPVSGATAAWLSDRFDLMATCFILCSLMALQRIESGHRNAQWTLALCIVLALASKETAVVLLPVALVWSLMSKGPVKSRLATALVALVSVSVFLAFRQHVLGTWGGGTMDASVSDSIANLISGLMGWAAHATSVLLGWPGTFSGTIGIASIVLLAGVLLTLYWRLRRSICPVALNTGVAGLVLAAAAAVAQSPVTRLVLRNDNPFEIETNLRFYYLALVGVLVAITVLADLLLRKWGRPDAAGGRAPAIGAALLGCLLAALYWNPTHAGLERWTHETGKLKRRQLEQASVETVLRIRPEPGCIVVLYGGGQAMNEFPLFSDSIVKAQLPVGSRWRDCMVMTEREPVFTLTGRDTATSFAALPQREITEGRHGPLASAGLLTYFPAPFDRCAWANRGLLHAFRWNGREFNEAVVVDATSSQPCSDRPQSNR